MADAPTVLSKANVDAIAQRVSNWGRWGPNDERGTLNFISDAKRLAAAALVKEGVTVSCALPVAVTRAVDNPEPAMHRMVIAGDVPESAVIPGMAFSADYLAMDLHGFSNTHLDALCHFIVGGKIYNGFDASEVKSNGAHRNSIMSGKDGIFTRGVLLDIPALRGVDWLEPRERITVDELQAAADRQGVRVEEGDVLFVSIGRDARRQARGPWPLVVELTAEGSDAPEDGVAGLGTDCLPWLHEHGVAIFGSDGMADVVPSGIDGWVRPIHQIGIVYIGLHMLCNLQLGRLAAACRERNRWEFLLTLGPLRLERGTASPVNPIAIF